jgi:hypothetical protein
VNAPTMTINSITLKNETLISEEVKDYGIQKTIQRSKERRLAIKS